MSEAGLRRPWLSTASRPWTSARSAGQFGAMRRMRRHGVLIVAAAAEAGDWLQDGRQRSRGANHDPHRGRSGGDREHWGGVLDRDAESLGHAARARWTRHDCLLVAGLRERPRGGGCATARLSLELFLEQTIDTTVRGVLFETADRPFQALRSPRASDRRDDRRAQRDTDRLAEERPGKPTDVARRCARGPGGAARMSMNRAGSSLWVSVR